MHHQYEKYLQTVVDKFNITYSYPHYSWAGLFATLNLPFEKIGALNVYSRFDKIDFCTVPLGGKLELAFRQLNLTLLPD